MGDDYFFIQYTNGFKNDPEFRQAAMSSLIITVLPAVDTTLSLFQKRDKMTISARSIGLTLMERVMFICGVACYATICFAPLLTESPRHLNFIFWGFENLSAILTINPILSFLCRCSALDKRIAIVIGLLVNCTGFFNSLMFAVDPMSPAMLALGQTCRITIALAAGIFMIVCLVSMARTYFLSSWKGRVHDSLGAQEDMADDRFRTGVICVHMISLSVNLCLAAIWCVLFYSHHLAIISFKALMPSGFSIPIPAFVCAVGLSFKYSNFYYYSLISFSRSAGIGLTHWLSHWE
jgi:hypothetical protein